VLSLRSSRLKRLIDRFRHILSAACKAASPSPYKPGSPEMIKANTDKSASPTNAITLQTIAFSTPTVIRRLYTRPHGRKAPAHY
jgi:hypothetical protein